MPADCAIFDLVAELSARPGRHPLSGAFELTSACNNRCLHCYLLEAEEYRPQTLPTPLVLSLLEVMEAEGSLNLMLTGGEPLLHPDFLHLYRTAVRRGFLVTVLTNGTLIDEAMADEFAALPPWRLSVTVYGGSPETYAAVTRNPAGYAALLRALDLLAARHLPFLLKFTALRENAHDLPAVARIAEHYGARLMFDGGITPATDGCTWPLAHRLPPAELVRLEVSLPEIARLLQASTAAGVRAASDRLFQCYAGDNQFFVNAQGEMAPCIEECATWPLDPDDAAGSFRRIFYEEFPSLIEQRGLAPECVSCDLWTLCLRCPAWRLKEVGDRGRPVPFFCELAQCRRDAAAALPSTPEPASVPHRTASEE